MEPLSAWIERQYRYAAAAMLASISAVHIVKRRPGFGQTIRPLKGSVVASPVLASWDPDPDYFFHWFRDSAVVMDALRLSFEAGCAGPQALQHVGDFVRFSLALQELDGCDLVTETAWRRNISTDFARFVRDAQELDAVRGEGVVAETRVNPDGTLDISNWTRPQHDGAPLRALTVLRWARSAPFDPQTRELMGRLVRADLAFTSRYWAEPCFDIWEEERGLHYYTLCVSAAALAEGAKWLESCGGGGPHAQYCAEARAIHRKLDGFWLPDSGFYGSRVLAGGERSSKLLDIAVVLAAIHATEGGIVHGVQDPRMQATFDRLEALFESAYPINHGRPAGMGAAMGRYAGDVYFSGGAYYFSTLGAAEFCYRAARGSASASDWVARGDAFLQTVRAYTPPSGELSEQFDQRTGEQTSARHLAWSYAAFISCITARRNVGDHPDMRRDGSGSGSSGSALSWCAR